MASGDLWKWAAMSLGSVLIGVGGTLITIGTDVVRRPELEAAVKGVYEMVEDRSPWARERPLVIRNLELMEKQLDMHNHQLREIRESEVRNKLWQQRVEDKLDAVIIQQKQATKEGT